MTTFSHTGDGPDGDAITLANAPGGSDNWTYVEKGTTGFYEYDTAQSITGTSSIKVGSTATADRAFMRWGNFTPTPTDKVSARFYAYMKEPVGSTGIMFAAQAAASARVASVSISSTGNVNVQDAVPSNVSVAGTFSLSWDTWYRFEVIVDRTVPSIVVAVFAGHGTTAIPGAGVTFSAAEKGTAGIDRVIFGKYSTSGSHTWWIDEIGLVTGSTTPLGPIAGGAAHYTLTTNHTVDTATVTSYKVDATASTGTTTLVQLSGTTATINESPTKTYTITNPAGTDSLSFRLTATLGGSSVQDIVIPRGGGAGGTEKPYRWTLQNTPATNMSNWK